MISDADRDILDQARASNIHWFNALLSAGQVQANRREKYSGSDLQNDDPFTNFITVACLMKLSVRDVFKFYIAQKVARLMVSDEDYDDERYADTLLDLANYALLAAGWEARDDDTEAILHTIRDTLTGFEMVGQSPQRSRDEVIPHPRPPENWMDNFTIYEVE